MELSSWGVKEAKIISLFDINKYKEYNAHITLQKWYKENNTHVIL